MFYHATIKTKINWIKQKKLIIIINEKSEWFQLLKIYHQFGYKRNDRNE